MAAIKKKKKQLPELSLPSLRQLRRTAVYALLAVGIPLMVYVATIGYRALRLWLAPAPTNVIAPLFTPQVTYWEPDILRWSEEHGIEPNLLATIMQIESCGHPTVGSPAGAQGLFQVMPFHFLSTEDQLDPDTNALRGANFIKECHRYASGDIGLTMACYNGGPSVTWKASAQWPAETRRYYHWGTAIYADALTRKDHSPTLDRWLSAGGARLCAQATVEIGRR